jgi:predicted ATPase
MYINALTMHPDRYPTSAVYPFNLPLFRNTPELRFNSPITFFIGENGSGKSTLLRALTRRCGVHIWNDSSRNRLDSNPYEDELYRFIDVAWSGDPKPGAFFSSETFQYLSQCIDNWACNDPGLISYFGGTSLLSQSNGQSFMAFFESRYAIEGVYFLDEPETALSPKNQIAFVKMLKRYCDQGHAQFFIATHSPILLSCPQAEIFSFDGPAIGTIPCGETGHFRLYRDFLNDPGRFLSAG